MPSSFKLTHYAQRRIPAVLVNQEQNPGGISGRVFGCISGSVGVVDTDLWTWGGTYFGHREGDELWTYDGRLVGRFVGDEFLGLMDAILAKSGRATT